MIGVIGARSAYGEWPFEPSGPDPPRPEVGRNTPIAIWARGIGQTPEGAMQTTAPVLAERWRKAYLAAVALVSSDQPYSDPIDRAARARAQRARTDLRRWIEDQKKLAASGQLSALQSLLMERIPDNWREIDRRRRRATLEAAASRALPARVRDWV